MDVEDAIDGCRLSQLSDQWVENTWKNDFADKTFPEEFTEVNLDVTAPLGRLRDEFKEYDGGWKPLVDVGVEPSALVAYISVFLRTNVRELIELDEDEKQAAVAASSAYFALLTLPDGAAYNVFHPVLYAQAVESLKLLDFIFNNEQQVRRKSVIVKMLVAALEDLNATLTMLKLDADEDSFRLTVNLVTAVAKLIHSPCVSPNFVYGLERSTDPSYLIYIGYQILIKLCDGSHGPAEANCVEILKSLLPLLLVTQEASNDQTRAHTLVFVEYLSRNCPSAQKPIKILTQQICVRCPERSSIRAKNADSIVKLLGVLQPDEYTSLVTWIASMSRSEGAKERTVCLEIMTKLLLQDERSGITHSFIFGIVLSRVDDYFPSVRNFALTILHNAFSNSRLKDIIHSLFADRAIAVHQETVYDLDALADALSLSSTVDWAGSYLTQIIYDLTRDKRAAVRKSSLSVLFEIYRLNKLFLNPCRIQALADSCRDPSLMVRWSVVEILTSLMHSYPDQPLMVAAWVRGVLPLTTDAQEKPREKAYEAVNKSILNGLRTTDGNAIAWQLLNFIMNDGPNTTDSFKHVCCRWVSEKRITSSLFAVFERCIGTELNLAVWFLLATLSEYVELPFPEIIHSYWLANIHNGREMDEKLGTLVVICLANNCRSLEKKIQIDLVSTISESLESFSVPLCMIPKLMDIFHTIQPPVFTDHFNPKIQDICHSVLKNEPMSNELLKRVMFTLGETAVVAPYRIDDEVLSRFKKMLLPYIKGRKQRNDEATAVLVTTLGKLGISHGQFAREVTPYIGPLLRNSTSPGILVNILATFTDYCSVYTATIEPYVSDMALCLKNENEHVRRSTFTSICTLVQGGFIKLKNPLFLYMWAAFIDPSDAIKQLASNFFMNTVLSKNAEILVHEFLPCFYLINNYQPRRNQNCLSELKFHEDFSLFGDENRESRGILLKKMIVLMDYRNQLRIIRTICKEVLDSLSGDEELTTKDVSIIKDIFHLLLSCDLLNIKDKSSGEEEEEGGDAEKTKPQEIKLKLFTMLRRKYIGESAPYILRFKQKLLELKSPLYNELLACLKQLFVNLGDDVTSFFGEDPIFAAELGFTAPCETNGMEFSEDELPPQPVASTSRQWKRNRTS